MPSTSDLHIISINNLLYALTTAALICKTIKHFFSSGQLMTSFLSTMSNKNKQSCVPFRLHICVDFCFCSSHAKVKLKVVKIVLVLAPPRSPFQSMCCCIYDEFEERVRKKGKEKNNKPAKQSNIYLAMNIPAEMGCRPIKVAMIERQRHASAGRKTQTNTYTQSMESVARYDITCTKRLSS